MNEESRRAAESSAIESDYRAKAVRTRAERRERIATTVLAGLVQTPEFGEGPVIDAAILSSDYAEALIHVLDERLTEELREGS